MDNKIRINYLYLKLITMRNPYFRLFSFIALIVILTGVTVPPVHPTYDWKVQGGQYNIDFGFWLGGEGDVNGDGYDDIIIGSPSFAHDYVGEGAAFIYYGSPAGLSHEPDWVTYGENDSAGYGRCVSIAGDVNGDGYDDVLVGSHQYSGTKVNEGKVYFYKGGPDGPETTPSWTKTSGRKQAKLGEALAMIGDINLDGYDDISVGAHGWDDDETLGGALGNKAGKAWIYLGTPDGPALTENFTEIGFTTDANIGVSLDKAGDINGDGYMDLAIGGYIFLIGDGMVCVFRGDETGVDEDLDFMGVGGAMDTSFYAINLSTAGDVNGDGYDDFVVGAPRYDANGLYQSGKLHLHYGSANGLQDEIGWIGTGSQYDERWAFNVNEGGDINHDGYGDLLVGSKYFDAGPITNAGKAELYLGGPQGLQRKPTWTFSGSDTSACVGTNLCVAGDVNGDGHEDIIVSGPEFSDEFEREGIVYAFYGQEMKCDPPQHPTLLQLTPNSALIKWNWLYGSEKYKLYMKRADGYGTQFSYVTQDSTALMIGLTPGTHYICYVMGKCEAGWTTKSTILEFTTPMPREGDVEAMKIYPTLVDQQITLYTGSQTGDFSITVFDAAGVLMFEKMLNITDPNATVAINEVGALPSGSYFISVQNKDSKFTTRFIRQ